MLITLEYNVKCLYFAKVCMHLHMELEHILTIQHVHLKFSCKHIWKIEVCIYFKA